MARSRLLRLLGPLLLVAACGGGRSGTGISESVEELITSQPGVAEPAAEAAASVVSTIQGNIAALDVAHHRPPGVMRWLASLVDPRPHSAHAAPALDGIRVHVEGFDPVVETGPDGSFILNGGFAGPLVVRFEREEDAIDDSMAVNVPKGGILSLRDVRFDAGEAVAAAAAQGLSFDGVIAEKDCLERRMLAASRFAPRGERYVIELDGGSINDESGKRVYCIEVHPGDDAHVEGIVRPNGSVGDSDVIIDGTGRMRQTMTTASQVIGAEPALKVPSALAVPTSSGR